MISKWAGGGAYLYVSSDVLGGILLLCPTMQGRHLRPYRVVIGSRIVIDRACAIR